MHLKHKRITIIFLFLLTLTILNGVHSKNADNLDMRFLNAQTSRDLNARWYQPSVGAAPGRPGRPLIYSQPSDEESDPNWSAITSSHTGTTSFLVYENFSGINDMCEAVRIWGMSLNNDGGWSQIDVDPFPFEIKFYDDANGMPGTELAVYQASANRTDAGFSILGFPVFYWHIQLPTTYNISQDGWVSVQEVVQQQPSDALLLWLSSSTGDGISKQSVDGVWETPDPIDRSLELYAPAATPGAPAAPANLTATPDPTGAMSCLIDWTNPTTTFDGQPLTALTSVVLYREDLAGTPLQTFTTVTPGQVMNFTDTSMQSSGEYTYMVQCNNAVGTGVATSVVTWIGEDAPAAVSNLVLVENNSTGVLTWTNPVNGINGYPLTQPITQYNILRSDNVSFTVPGIHTTWTDTSIPLPMNYYYTVTTENSVGIGGSETSNSVYIGSPGVVLNETFDSFPPTGWTAEGNWAGSNTSTAGGVAPEARHNWSPQINGDFRLISPPLDTSGMTGLAIEFTHYFDHYTSSIYLKFETSSDGANWNTVWQVNASTNIGPEIVSQAVNTVDVGSATMQIAFTVSGNTNNMDDWFIDDVMLFEATNPPTCSVLNLPVDGATDIGIFGDFTWDAAFGAPSGYYLYLGTDGGGISDPTDVYNGFDVGNVLSFAFSGLAFETTYYWSIVPYNGNGAASGCPIRSFTTLDDPTISVFPYFADFELNGALPNYWTQDINDEHDWTLIVGSTGSNGTGPNGDHTSGNGYYLYYETSTPVNQGDECHLLTNYFDLTGLSAPTLEFYYHMLGTGMGTFTVDILDVNSNIWTDDIWSASGNQGDQWILANTGIGGYGDLIQLRFRGIDGSSYSSDMAFDDVTIYDNTAPPGCSNPVLPIDGAIDVLEFGNLEWIAASASPTGYRIYMGTDGGGVTPPTDIHDGLDLGNTLSMIYNGLAYDTTYYWQVIPELELIDLLNRNSWSANDIHHPD